MIPSGALAPLGCESVQILCAITFGIVVAETVERNEHDVRFVFLAGRVRSVRGFENRRGTLPVRG